MVYKIIKVIDSSFFNLPHPYFTPKLTICCFWLQTFSQEFYIGSKLFV